MIRGTRGRWGERCAVLWLVLKGYWPLARNRAVRRGSGAGEIDLIVRRGSLVAFVEVKVRQRRDDASYAIRPAQQKRIIRAAEVFLAQHPDLAGCDCRFDAVLIAPWCWPCHIRGAWRIET